MDSYDEVHDVKNGRDISTPELDVSSAIKFVNSEHDDVDDGEVFEGDAARNVPEEVKLASHARFLLHKKFPWMRNIHDF